MKTEGSLTNFYMVENEENMFDIMKQRGWGLNIIKWCFYDPICGGELPVHMVERYFNNPRK